MERRPGDEQYLRGLEALDQRPASAPVAAPAPHDEVDALWSATAPATAPATAAASRQPRQSQPANRHAPAPSATPADPVLQRRRRSIRSSGPVLALLPPLVLGGIAAVLLRDNVSRLRGVGGFVLAVLAAPVLPMAGVPLRSGSSVILLAAAASAVLWLLLGWFAARRATFAGGGSWPRFWGEYLWMVLAVWLGVLLAVGAANVVLGRSLL